MSTYLHSRIRNRIAHLGGRHCRCEHCLRCDASPGSAGVSQVGRGWVAHVTSMHGTLLFLDPFGSFSAFPSVADEFPNRPYAWACLRIACKDPINSDWVAR